MLTYMLKAQTQRHAAADVIGLRRTRAQDLPKRTAMRRAEGCKRREQILVDRLSSTVDRIRRQRGISVRREQPVHSGKKKTGAALIGGGVEKEAKQVLVFGYA
jgi:hypothetical protein